MHKKACSFARGMKKTDIVYFLMSIITILITWLIFDYLDITTLTAWSIDFWDLVFNRNLHITDFYDYTANNYHGAYQLYCEGEFLSFLPLFIWNLPLWIVMKIFSITSVNNIYILSWSKLCFVFAHLGIAWLACRINKKLGGGENQISALLVLAAPEIIISTCYAGQDEVIYIFSLLVGVLLILYNRWKMAFVFLVVTVTCCPIMILPVTAILLLKEKRIGKLLLYEAILFVPLFLFEVIFHNNEIYQTVKQKHSLSVYGMQMLEDTLVNTGVGAVSISVVLCLLILLWCYCKGTDNAKNYLTTVTLIMVIICFGMSNIFYRQFLYVPFLIILIMDNITYIDFNVFLFTVFTYMRVLRGLWVNEVQNMNIVWVVRDSWVTFLCDKVNGSQRYLDEGNYLINYLNDNQYTELIKIISGSASLACVMVLLYINCICKECKFESRVSSSIVKHKFSLLGYVLCMPLLLIGCWYMLLR